MTKFEKLKSLFLETSNIKDTVGFLNHQQALLLALADYILERDSHEQNKGETE